MKSFRVFSSVWLAVVLGLLGVAFAQTTPTPDTETITNQASATYTDAANQTLTATSNTVTTDVLPIYRFAITPNGTDTANAGGVTANNLNGTVGESVVFTYGVENQGNTTNNTINLSVAQSATDQFDFGAATIYLDGGDGIFGTADDTIVKAAGDTTGSVTVPYGQSRTLFVVAPILTGTANNTVGRLNLEGNSALGGQSDTDNWAQATVFTNAILSLDKTTTATTVIPGDTITYNLSGSNTGGSSPFAVDNVATIDGNLEDGIIITDVFPATLSYVSGTLALSGTNTTGTRQLLYSNNSGTTWTTTPVGTVNAVALFIPGTAGQRINPAVPPVPAFAYSFTFDVTVPAGAPANSSLTNTGTLNYDINGDGDAADTGEVVTDDAISTVNPSGNFVVGPFEDADANDTLADYTLNGFTVSRSGDTQTISSVPNGRAIRFEHSLLNGANFDDTYTFAPTVPAGFPGSVAYYRVGAGGALGTEITAGDPLAVAAGATAEFYTVITLPGDFTSAAALDFVTTATNSQNTVTSDATTDTLGAVTEAQAVNISNNDANNSPNPVPNETPVTKTTPSGQTVLFPLVVANGGVDTDIFDLAPTSGFTVTLYSDANCDGVIDAGTDVVVTDTGNIPAGGSVCLIAAVVVPAGATATDYPVTVTATSQTDSTIIDSITDTVTVNLEGTFTFDDDLSRTIPAGSSTVYQHLITNNQNDAVTVVITETEPGTTGWTYEYSLDGVTYYATLAELPVINVAAAGGTQDVYVRVTVPAGAARNDLDTFTLTATPSRGTADTITDTTRVNANPGGTLELLKSVDKASAEPGETLTYTIVGTNTGASPVTNVKITDPVPANTSFDSLSATASFAGDVLYSTNGTTWTDDATTLTVTNGTTTGNGSTIYVGVDTNGDDDITTADEVPEDGSITVTFTVTIN